MNKNLIYLIIVLPLTFISSFVEAAAPRITGPDMEIINNNIIVSLSIAHAADLETTIKSGIEKEIIFTVELLREWRFWPDEFVVSKKISRVIKFDTLREQYRASSNDGVTRYKKNFKDYGAVKNWIFTVNSVNLANLRELESGSYYIRTVVESKSREHLPFIGLLMIFIPEVEMSLAKESPPFILEDDQ